MKNSIIAYLNTFSEHGKMIPDDLAETINDVVASAMAQLNPLEFIGIAATTVGVTQQSDISDSLSLIINHGISGKPIDDAKRVCVAAYHTTPIISIGMYPYAVASVGTTAFGTSPATCLQLLIVTCATAEVSHVCTIDNMGYKKYTIIGTAQNKEETYEDEETRKGAELLQKDVGILAEKSGVLSSLKKLPQFDQLNPLTGNKAAIFIPEFPLNEDLLASHRGDKEAQKRVSDGKNSVNVRVEIVDRDKISQYIIKDYEDKTKLKVAVRAANMLLNEIVNWLLAIKPLIDTDNRILSMTKFVVGMHEKICRAGIIKQITIRDFIKFLDEVIPECFGQTPDNPERGNAVTVSVLNTAEIGKIVDSSVVEPDAGISAQVVNRTLVKLSQTAYKLVQKKFGVLPKISQIPKTTISCDVPEDASFCKIVDVIEKNNVRLAVCREVSVKTGNAAVVFVLAAVDHNRSIYDALDKDAVLIKPAKSWRFGVVENEQILKKCGSTEWGDVLNDAADRSSALDILTVGYVRASGLMTKLPKSPLTTDSEDEVAGRVIGSYVQQIVSSKTVLRFEELQTEEVPASGEGTMSLTADGGSRHNQNQSTYKICGVPHNWIVDSFSWQSCNARELLSNAVPTAITALTSQQLGFVTVRRANEQIAANTIKTAAASFNRGLLRLISTGKEFKFALNPSSAEMIVRKDEIIFGGRKIKSKLVNPAPSMTISASQLQKRLEHVTSGYSSQADFICKTLSQLSSEDPELRRTAREKLNNDHIIINFLCEVYTQFKTNSALKHSAALSSVRHLFEPTYPTTSGYSAQGDTFDFLGLKGRIYENGYMRDNARWSKLMHLSSNPDNASYRGQQEISAIINSLFFTPASDVAELFDFNNLVNNVIKRAVGPELLLGSTVTDYERLAAGVRFEQLDASRWVVDEITIGDVKVEVTVTTTKDKKLTTTNRYFINGHQIKAAELTKAIAMATCFENTESYNEAVSQISDVSLAARNILQNGFLVEIPVGQSAKISNIMLEIDRVKNKWSLIVRDREGIIKKTLHIPGGISRFIAATPSSGRKKKMTSETFASLIGDIPGLEFVDIKRIHENGFTRYNQIVARSRKFLEDVIQMVGATFGTYQIGRAKCTGYSVKGMSGRSYVVACSDIAKDRPFENDHGTDKFGAIYSVETGEYVCVVDRSNDQSGYDVIANRLLAMANDAALVDQIHTLGKFVHQ